MKIRSFRGKTMAEALARVKKQLGPDALILNTRSEPAGGVLGVGASECVTITATDDVSGLPAPLRRGTLRQRVRPSISADGAAAVVSSAPKPTRTPPQDALLAEFGSLKSVVNDLVRETRRSRMDAAPAALLDTYTELVQNAVGDELAHRLVAEVRDELDESQLRDTALVRAKLAGAVEAMLPTAGPVQLRDKEGPTIIALIGPTGVGKTTTVAKLAANFCLREHKRVGMITIDTYRIAAVEQLRTYAQIIDVPLEVVMRPEELSDAVERMSDCDLILIDTAGRSQRDTVKIHELKKFFAIVPPDEVHLVLSSTSGEAVLLETIERFTVVDIDRVLFTKLDEAIGFGVILSCLQKAKAGLSYVTTGQDVPDDIRVGEGKVLAQLIVGGMALNDDCSIADGLAVAKVHDDAASCASY